MQDNKTTSMKIFIIIMGLALLLPVVASAQANVLQGGTGTTTVPADRLLYGLNSFRLSHESNFTYDPDTDTLSVDNLTVSGTCTNCGGGGGVFSTSTDDLLAYNEDHVFVIGGTASTTLTQLFEIFGIAGADTFVASSSAASSTLPWLDTTFFSATQAYFGGTASSSFGADGNLTINPLTASRLVATDANKILVSTITEGNLESSVSGVTNIFTDVDGALNDDDLTDDTLTTLSNVDTSGVAAGDSIFFDGTNWIDFSTSTQIHTYEMDAFSELDALVTDKSLVNLEDAQTFSSLITFSGGASTTELSADLFWAGQSGTTTVDTNGYLTTLQGTSTDWAITNLASVPLYADANGDIISAGSGASGNCVEWGASNLLADSGSGCGGGSSELTDAGRWLYPTEDTDSFVIGSSSLDVAAVLSVHATSTAGDIIRASSTTGFTGNFLNFVDDAGASLLNVIGSGEAKINAPTADFGAYLTVRSTSSVSNNAAITIEEETGGESITMGVDPNGDFFISTETPITSNYTLLIDTSTREIQSGTGAGDAQMYGGSPSESLPAFSFVSDVNTGMYRIGADQLGFSAGGVNNLSVLTTGASSTQLSVNEFWAGGLATTSIDANGNLVVGGELIVPNDADPTVATNSELAVNTTTASSSLRYYDGNNEVAFYASSSHSFTLGTSTIAAYGGSATATATIPIGISYRGETWEGIKCYTAPDGQYSIEVGDGNNFMEFINCTNATTTAEFSDQDGVNDDDGTMTNNTFTWLEARYIRVGTETSSPTGALVIVPIIRKDAD